MCVDQTVKFFRKGATLSEWHAGCSTGRVSFRAAGDDDFAIPVGLSPSLVIVRHQTSALACPPTEEMPAKPESYYSSRFCSSSSSQKSHVHVLIHYS
jgi:hypothetical protein